MRFAAAALATLVAATAVAGCSTGGDPSPRTSTHAGSATVSGRPVTTVADDLHAPWSVAFYERTALLSERDSGRILELGADGTKREVGTIQGVTASGEGGLLGIAIQERYLYAYFTSGDENRVQRFGLTGTPGALGIGPARTILQDLPAAGNHNGGRIAFGPDGMLYVCVGDAGDAAAAQDPASRAGKILRVTRDGKVPEDNPVDGSPVYSRGHRNPQGLAWAPDGTMYATEFGQNTWDELNVIRAGGNYGWPTVEGIAHDERFIDPVQQWAPADASPSGMTIAGGSIWVANLRGERLREIALDDPGVAAEHLVGTHGRLRDVVGAPDGTLWVLTNNTDGRGEARPGDDRVLRVPLG